LADGALYVDPTDQRELEVSLERVLTSGELRQHMREAGLAAARRLTWEGIARQMIDLFNHVVVR
jgi:glycosyltransferase involved in cell wall biosynthesis